MVLPIIVSWLVIYFWGMPTTLHSHQWVVSWLHWVESALSDIFGKVTLLVIVLVVPVLLFGVIYELVGDGLYGFLGLCMSIWAILFSCGRFYYFDQIARFKRMLQQQDRDAILQMAEHLGATVGDDDTVDGSYIQIRQILCFRAFSQWFGAAVWFLFLGAPGVIFYGLCRVFSVIPVANVDEDPENFANRLCVFAVDRCSIMLYWMDWLAVRGWLMVLAISGDFSRVSGIIKQEFFTAKNHMELIDQVNAATVESESLSRNSDASEPFDFSAAYLEVDKIEAANNNAMMIALVGVLVFIALM